MHTQSPRSRVRFRLVIALVLLAPAVAQACPNCKEAVAAGGADGAQVARGYSYSILLMLGMPIALLGTGAFLVARAVKHGAIPPI